MGLLLVVLGVAALFATCVVVFVMLRRNSPRMHHYQFAHVILPKLLFEDPASVIIPLITDSEEIEPRGRDYLLNIWDFAGTHTPDGRVVAADGLSHCSEVLGSPNTTVIFITMPPPELKPEAYFAAIAFDGPGLALGTPRLLRYFVLEYHGAKDGEPLTVVGEWQESAGQPLYTNHGPVTQADHASFRQRVRELIGA